MPGGCLCRRDDHLLEPAGGAQMIGRPDDAGGRGRVAVGAGQIVPDGVGDAVVRDLVIGQRVARLLPADPAARQVFVPGPRPLERVGGSGTAVDHGDSPPRLHALRP